MQQINNNNNNNNKIIKKMTERFKSSGTDLSVNEIMTKPTIKEIKECTDRLKRVYYKTYPLPKRKEYDRRNLPFVLTRPEHTKMLSKRINNHLVNKISDECLNKNHYKCNRLTCGCPHHRGNTIGDIIQAQLKENKSKLNRNK